MGLLQQEEMLPPCHIVLSLESRYRLVESRGGVSEAAASHCIRQWSSWCCVQDLQSGASGGNRQKN
jgi:hypothetical protein